MSQDLVLIATHGAVRALDTESPGIAEQLHGAMHVQLLPA